MELTLGFSPCPNDTFIFDALVNKKIDTEGLEFKLVLEDVETLNSMALEGRLAITKLSFPAFFQSLEHYVLLNSGSALGKGVGPLLISKEAVTDEGALIPGTVALPGLHTTANLLFSYAYPSWLNKQFMVFSEIENAVLDGLTDYGVIIHENRFTYEQRGLHKVKDLGEYWEEKMRMPIPLGGIAIDQSIKFSTAGVIEKLIRKSLEYAFANYPAIPEFVKMHSQEMDEEVMRQHIDLYVNDYSLNLGEGGQRAIESLFEVFHTTHPHISSEPANFFLNSLK